MKRSLAAAASILLLLTFVPSVSAGSQGTQCTGETVYAYFYENVIGDTSDGNDSLYACADRRADLGDISHTLPGDCHAPPLNKVTWNDCVSAFTVIQPAGYSFCAYSDSNYHRLVQNRKGNVGKVNVSAGDQWSSYKMINTGPNGTCPNT